MNYFIIAIPPENGYYIGNIELTDTHTRAHSHFNSQKRKKNTMVSSKNASRMSTKRSIRHAHIVYNAKTLNTFE